ncbi:hypothetical protein V6Z11_D12G085400 [Gossypium hirsutum]
MGHDILPMYENISKIRRDFDCMCSHCGSEKETLIHALKDCSKARAVLMYGGIDNALVDGHYRRCVDWFEDTARSLDKKALSDFVTVLWNIWNSRDNKVFRNTGDEARVIWDRAAVLKKDFCSYNFLVKPLIPKPVGEKRWQKPGTGVVKINFDAVVNRGRMSFGIVVRDHEGFVLGGRAGVMENLELEREKRWLKLELESDWHCPCQPHARTSVPPLPVRFPTVLR